MVDTNRPLKDYDLSGKSLSVDSKGRPTLRSKGSGKFTGWVTRAGGAVKGAVSKIPYVGPRISAPPKPSRFEVRVEQQEAKEAKIATKTEKYEEEIKKLELKRVRREAGLNTSVFDTDRIVSGAKRYSKTIVLVLLLLSPIILFVLLGMYSHTGPFSYQLESYYGPVLNSVINFVSPLINLVGSDLACVSNPLNCVGQQTSTSVTTVYPTFTDFLSPTQTPNPATLFLPTSTNNPGQLFYSITNGANVPLGADTNNAINFSASCGSDGDNPAATFICQGTTTLNPPVQENLNLLPYLLPGQTVENVTNVYTSCPNNTEIQLPAIGNIAINFTVQNYSAGTIAPIEFISSTFDQQLISSSQGLTPNGSTINFVTPGPVQVEISLNLPPPIITDTQNIPVTIQLNDMGTAAYHSFHVNKLVIFIPKSLWPNNPNESGLLGWNCVTSTSAREINFVLPGSDYWACTSTIESEAIVASGVQIVLPEVNTALLGGMHFDTVPIMAYVNYNYEESLPISYVLRPESGASCYTTP